MIGLRLKRLRNVFKGPELGLFLDSDQLRGYYQRSDEMVEHHFDQVLNQDLVDLQAPQADHDAWSWS
jgi:hypothetical protein